jgi:hypothetical protein
MPAEEATLLASKTQFLNSQVRILSQPLKASARWKDEAEMPETVVSDVMKKSKSFYNKFLFLLLCMQFHTIEYAKGTRLFNMGWSNIIEESVES